MASNIENFGPQTLEEGQAEVDRILSPGNFKVIGLLYFIRSSDGKRMLGHWSGSLPWETAMRVCRRSLIPSLQDVNTQKVRDSVLIHGKMVKYWLYAPVECVRFEYARLIGECLKSNRYPSLFKEENIQTTL